MSETITDASAAAFAAQMAERGLDAGPTLAHFGRRVLAAMYLQGQRIAAYKRG